MVGIVAELSLTVTLPFLQVFAVAIRLSLRVFAIAILHCLQEPLRTVATFVASASRVPTLVLVLAPLAVLVQGELNEARPIEVGPASAEEAASVADVALVVEEACAEGVADVAADGIDEAPPGSWLIDL
jgi:hypothetical protein